MQPYAIVLITIGCVLAAELLCIFLMGGGSLARLGLACRAFGRVLGDTAVAERVQALLAAPAQAEQTKKKSAEPLLLLALLQREGRVLDFFLEDVSGAPDDALGAGVREIHSKAQGVLKEHLVLEPVLQQPEGSSVEVPAGFDPSAIRVVGNVTGNPPFRGILKHQGWRVKDYDLPSSPQGQDEFVMAPAEVELP
jgi:hypothetical protein